MQHTDLKLKIKVCIINFQNLQSKKENKHIQRKCKAKGYKVGIFLFYHVRM